jgi:hypothetical protein
MDHLSPKESKHIDLPQPAQSIIISNETVASVGFEAELQENTLVLTFKSLTLGATQEAPFQAEKKVWKLS